MAIFDFPSKRSSTQSTSQAPPHWKEVTIFTMLAGFLAGLAMTIRNSTLKRNEYQHE